ncbi:MAG: hypothetical protein JWM64_141 [Frankiales bacterium]|nr:hypothetical protein [Frankiales bacterium]
MLDDVLVVAVAGVTDDDVARLQGLVQGAGVVDVGASRADLERWMDAVEQQLTATGELAGFLQMAPDGFRSRIALVVDAPVPLLRAWAAEHLPPGALEVTEEGGPPPA